jgi:hypothetical protein
MFSRWNRLVLAAAVAAILSACGGGDGDSADLTVATGTPGAEAPGTGTGGTGTGGTGTGGTGGTGGEGGTTQPIAAAADKYVGTWRTACFQEEPGLYARETFTLAKTGDNALSMQLVVRFYGASSTCTTETTADTYTGTVSITGQTTASYQGSARQFDRVAMESPQIQGTEHWLAGILADGRLLIDFDDVNQTTEYPTNPNEGNTIYTKQ